MESPRILRVQHELFLYALTGAMVFQWATVWGEGGGSEGRSQCVPGQLLLQCDCVHRIRTALPRGTNMKSLLRHGFQNTEVHSIHDLVRGLAHHHLV